jgi:hypothetical protein
MATGDDLDAWAAGTGGAFALAVPVPSYSACDDAFRVGTAPTVSRGASGRRPGATLALAF